MKLSFITDEVSQDFDTVIAFARQYGFTGLELRSVADTTIDQIALPVLLEYREKLCQNGLRVSNLASNFYKCSLQSAQEIAQNLAKLRRLCEIADLLDCSTIRGFAFFKDGTLEENLPAILAAFKEPISILEQYHKTLLLESDPSVFTQNHSQLACVLQKLDSPFVGAIYDPGNDLYDPAQECPYPTGYDAIKPFLRHVHVKDAKINAEGLPECVKIGTGAVDYPALLTRLTADEYDGWFSVETHYRKNAVISEELMRLPQGSSFSAGGLEATAECAVALRELMEVV